MDKKDAAYLKLKQQSKPNKKIVIEIVYLL